MDRQRFPFVRRPSPCAVAGRVARRLIAVLILVASPAATRGITQVDCDSTADFCTGDPCVTSDVLEVTASPCTLDFGSATLRIEKKIRLTLDGGTLSLTAGNIEVNAKIDGKHIKAADPNGSQVSLTSPGSITVNRKIDVSARASAGSIALDAGANIAINHQLLARSKGRNLTATGGTVTVDADGTVTSHKRGKLIVRGKKGVTDAGQVSVVGGLGVDLDGRIEARGLNAGTVAVTSSAGNVSFDEEIRAYGEPDNGGAVNISSSTGDVTVSGLVRTTGAGSEGGGDVAITGANVDVNQVTASGNGGLTGGSISIVGGVVTVRRVLSRGGDGGSIVVSSTLGTAAITERIDVRGQADQGGSVSFDAATDGTVTAHLNAIGKNSGGSALFTAAGNLTLGEDGGSNYDATAPAGGTIEASAGGDLTVSGEYEVQVGGCIGLSAGGTLDVSMATFDTTPMASCP